MRAAWVEARRTASSDDVSAAILPSNSKHTPDDTIIKTGDGRGVTMTSIDKYMTFTRR